MTVRPHRIVLRDINNVYPHPTTSLFYKTFPHRRYMPLRDDVAQNGIINPIHVTADGTILSGHLRWMVAKELKLPSVPTVLMNVPPDRQTKYIFDQNEHRLTRFDKLLAFDRLKGVPFQQGGFKGSQKESSKGPKSNWTLWWGAQTLNITEAEIKHGLKLLDLLRQKPLDEQTFKSLVPPDRTLQSALKAVRRHYETLFGSEKPKKQTDFRTPFLQKVKSMPPKTVEMLDRLRSTPHDHMDLDGIARVAQTNILQTLSRWNEQDLADLARTLEGTTDVQQLLGKPWNST